MASEITETVLAHAPHVTHAFARSVSGSELYRFRHSTIPLFRTNRSDPDLQRVPKKPDRESSPDSLREPSNVIRGRGTARVTKRSRLILLAFPPAAFYRRRCVQPRQEMTAPRWTQVCLPMVRSAHYRDSLVRVPISPLLGSLDYKTAVWNRLPAAVAW